MKEVTLTLVEEPVDYKTVRFAKADYDAAKKKGDIKTVYSNAREAIRLSGGMYKIKPEEAIREIAIKGLKEPEEMTSEELVGEMTAHGKPPRKKMNRQVAIDFVRKLREEAKAMIVDDEVGDDEDE